MSTDRTYTSTVNHQIDMQNLWDCLCLIVVWYRITTKCCEVRKYADGTSEWHLYIRVAIAMTSVYVRYKVSVQTTHINTDRHISLSVCMYAHAHTHTCVHTHTHARTHIYTHTHTHTHTRTHTHARTHAHTHAHTLDQRNLSLLDSQQNQLTQSVATSCSQLQYSM